MDSMTEWDTELFDDVDTYVEPVDQDDSEEEPEAEAPVEEKKEAAAAEPVAPVKPLKKEQQPKGTIEISVDHAKDYQAIREALLAKDSDPDKAALTIADIMERRDKKVMEALKAKTDEVYFTSPEGQHVKQLMTKYQGLTKDVAKQIYMDTLSYQQQVELTRKGKTGGEMEGAERLSDKDKRILNKLGVSSKDYLADLKEIKKGKWVTINDKGIMEVTVDIPMTDKKGGK